MYVQAHLNKIHTQVEGGVKPPDIIMFDSQLYTYMYCTYIHMDNLCMPITQFLLLVKTLVTVGVHPRNNHLILKTRISIF